MPGFDVLPMTYLNSRSAPLKDDISRFTSVDLVADIAGLTDSKLLGFTASFSLSWYDSCANSPFLDYHKYGGFIIRLTKMSFFLTFVFKIK